MSERKTVLHHIRSNLVAYIALFFALSGTAAYAAPRLMVYSEDIVDGQVFGVDVADENLTGVDIHDGGLTGVDVAANSIDGSNIADGSLTSLDVQDASLTGTDVLNGTLLGLDVQDGSLTGNDVAGNSLTGADVVESTLSVAEMGCQSGKVLGFARVKGFALSQDQILDWTSDPRYIDITNNCAFGQVLVRGWGIAGRYDVKFVGNPAVLAVTTNNDVHVSFRNIVSVEKVSDYFAVQTQRPCAPGDAYPSCRAEGTRNADGNFTILLP